MNNFITFHKIFEDTLRGKIIKVRDYGEYNNWEEFEYDKDYSPISWLENDKYVEWTGKVKKLLHCDNGHFDIIFERDEHHKFPKGYLEDCFNWRLNDYLILLD